MKLQKSSYELHSSGMPKFALQLKACLNGVNNLEPSDHKHYRWYLRLKCGSCGEESKNWQYATRDEIHTLAKGRGECHISWRCHFCKRTSTLEILSDSYNAYSAEKNNQYQTIVKFDCRGLEPVNFEPRVGWKCVGSESGTLFDEIDLNETVWADYDERVAQPVEITDISIQFVVAKDTV